MNQNEDHALSDKALRQALLRGLDKETYCNTLLEGGATAGKAPVPPTLDFGFDDLKDENSYDPDSAKKILDEAGYKDVDGDGFVETPDGDPLVLDFVIYTSRAELGVYAQAAQASLKEIGINVNLNTVSYETLLDMRDSGQYDLLIWNVLVANTGDPENYLRENWYSSSANNTAGYNNPEVDKLLDELAQTFDEDKRKDLIIDIQQDIMDDAATVFFGYETTYLFSNKKVTGVKMYPMDYSNTKDEWRNLRGTRISMIFQDCGGTLNPIRKIGSQYVEYICTHTDVSKAEAWKKGCSMLQKMRLPDAENIMKSYPHQLSGGMRQRVGIAMAMTFNPELLLADEPTSALDVTTQAQIVRQMMELRDDFGTGIIIVTHNIGVAAYMADQLVVMQNGKVVDQGTRDEVMEHPTSDYTKKLLAAVPEMEGQRYV